MNEWRQPPTEVPTLTEIIDEGQASQGSAVVLPLRAGVQRESEDLLPAEVVADVAHADTGVAIDEDALFMEVLAEVRTQVDRMVEYRLREAMAPVLAKALDVLVQDAKAELSATLQDVLRRAVAQVIARNRPR